MKWALLLLACSGFAPAVGQEYGVVAQLVDFSRLGATITAIGPRPQDGASLFEEIAKVVGRLESLGASRVAAVYTDNEYGKEAAVALRRFSAAANIHVTGQVLDLSASNLASISARVAETDAEAVFVFADTVETARFVTKYRAVDPATPIYTIAIVAQTVLGAGAAPSDHESQALDDPRAWRAGR